MATQVKRRRGTAANNASFTGAAGEIVGITDTNRIAIHDGATAGGKTFLNAQDIQNKAGVYATVGGTANAITLAHTFPRTAHTDGAEITFKATADNSSSVTVAVDAIAGTKALQKMVAGVATALATGDIKNGVVYTARYDGTRYQLVTGGASVSVTEQVFTGSGTYTPTSGMKYCQVIATGGGGGGGGVQNTDAIEAGGGGGAGGTSIKVFTAATIGASQVVTIGAAGTAGTTGGTTGGTGGTTTFGALLTGNGGAGGSGSQAAAAARGDGGNGGTATTGTINLTGGGGSVGGIVSATSTWGGAGGASYWGGGGAAKNTDAAGEAGGAYGAGGGGGAGGSASYAGGGGAAGVIYVIEFF